MRFPNASRGIRRIFNAEMLGLVSAGLIIIMLIIIITGVNTLSITNGKLAVSGALLIICAILGIVGFVLNLMGITDAKKDEDSFRFALYAALAGVAISLVSGFIREGNDTIVNALTVAKSICELLVTYYVLTGIMTLADKMSDETVSNMANRARNLVCCAFGLSAALNLIMTVTNASSNTLSLIFGIIAALFSIAGYVYYLRVLSRTKIMLQ